MPRDNRSGAHNRSKSLHTNIFGNSNGSGNGISGSSSSGGGGGGNGSNYNAGSHHTTPLNIHFTSTIGGGGSRSQSHHHNVNNSRNSSLSANSVNEGGSAGRCKKFFTRNRNTNGSRSVSNCPGAHLSGSMLTCASPSTSKQWRENLHSALVKPTMFSSNGNNAMRRIGLMEIQREFPLWMPAYKSSSYKVIRFD